MSAAKIDNVTELDGQNLSALLELQRSGFRAEGEVTYATRIDRLKRLKALIVENKKEFANTTKREYGGERSYEFSLFSEFASKVEAIEYSIKHLKKWMKPVTRKANKPMNFLGGKSQVRYFPKGVVGIISPWNLPFGLTVAPLTSALAAGNRHFSNLQNLFLKQRLCLPRLCPGIFRKTKLLLLRAVLILVRGLQRCLSTISCLPDPPELVRR